MAKTISFSLSSRSIGNAVKELETYNRSIDEKVKRLRDIIAERLRDYAEQGFLSSPPATRLDGIEVPPPDVKVTTEPDGNITAVIASGEDVYWIEFGAGVYYNTPVGSSPHPMGQEFGLTIGSYGKGRGSRKTWGYYEDGKLVLTHGTPANMPMWKAAERVAAEYPQIAKEVFGT
jgi:hypothetical protein